MKKQMTVLALAALLAAPAMAAEGAVFGFDYGNTKLEDDGLKASGSGAGVYGGYRFSDSLALEAGYRRLLSDTVRFAGQSVKITGTTFQASVLGYLPLGSDFSLFGRLGAGKLKAKASGPGGVASESDTKALFGLGLEYDFSKNVALRAEYQKPASDTRTLSLGLKFSF
ncbi:MAG: outer membrane beta-barrel protein [Burkholderiales bacterium]|nr:outer membrane beta-barrel protein [Burkholderiales bacterium]